MAAQSTSLYAQPVRSRRKEHSVQTLAVLVLLFLFAVSALVLMAMGSAVYRKNVASTAALSEHRTAYAYLTEKVRQQDAAGSLRVQTLDADGTTVDVLVLSKEVRGEEYQTLLYVLDDYLREMTVRADTTVSLGTGAAILPAKALRMTQEEAQNLLFLTLTSDDGEELPLTLTLRSGKEAP